MVRRAKHVKDYREGNEHSPLIKHIRQFPGHSFNPSDARLIWKTHSKHETQFVEAACIKRFPSCNRSYGEVKVSNVYASLVTNIAGIQNDRLLPTFGERRHNVPAEASTTVSSNTLNIPPLPTAMDIVQPGTMQQSSNIHFSQEAGPSGAQGMDLHPVSLAGRGSSSNIHWSQQAGASGVQIPRLLQVPSASLTQDDVYIHIGVAEANHDVIRESTAPTVHVEVPSNGGRNLVPTGTGRRPTGSDRNIPAATRSPARSTLMPRRVTELIKENNELGNYNAASGNNSIHGHASSQPTRLNATHHESRGISNSQPAGSISTEYLSPRKTRSQGRTNFRKL